MFEPSMKWCYSWLVECGHVVWFIQCSWRKNADKLVYPLLVAQTMCFRMLDFCSTRDEWVEHGIEDHKVTFRWALGRHPCCILSYLHQKVDLCWDVRLAGIGLHTGCKDARGYYWRNSLGAERALGVCEEGCHRRGGGLWRYCWWRVFWRVLSGKEKCCKRIEFVL